MSEFLFFADGIDRAGGHAEGIASIGLAVVTFGLIDDIAGIAL